MERHITRVEDQITKLLGSILDDGQTFAEKYSSTDNLASIPEIPINDFQDLLNMVRQGDAIVRMAPFSMNSTIFNMLATKIESFVMTAFGLGVYVMPVVGIIMGFLLSW